MEKLELKHLAPYLPYELDFTHLDGKKLCTSRMKGLYILNEAIYVNGFNINKYTKFKPILRPLSDLTKEIEISGVKFIPRKTIKEWEKLTWSDDYFDEYFNRNVVDFIEWKYLKLLFEWHFDVFGLIEKGLAIKKTT